MFKYSEPNIRMFFYSWLILHDTTLARRPYLVAVKYRQDQFFETTRINESPV